MSEPTIKRLESQDGELGGRADTAAKIVAALEAAGVEFTDGNAPGVKLHKAGARIAAIPVEDLNAENDE